VTRTASDPAAGIHRLGFRRWYERQLLESHCWLVSCVLAMLLVAVCIEDLSFKEGPAQALVLIAVSVAGTVLAVSAWQRYQGTMALAEHLGARSSCAKCEAYGRFEVLASAGANATDTRTPPARIGWLHVRCKRCGHEWTLD
jgi:hypothetical protein